MRPLWGATMAAAHALGNRPRGLFPRLLLSLLLGLSAQMNLDRNVAENQLLSSNLILLSNFSNTDWRRDQLFRSGLIRFSNSSIEVSPLIFSPLMKKVGVESTFNTSEAYFWSAAILSSSA